LKKIYLIALLFAILTGIAVYNYANFLQKSAQKDLVTVVTAVKRIPENTLVTAEMIELRNLPKEAVNPLAVDKLSVVEGRITNTLIEANEQVLSTRLNEKGVDKGGLTYTVPEGRRAITVEVNDISGVAGYIKKGNRVDIVAYIMFDKQSKTLMLLQNIEVLLTSTASASADPKAVGYKNITLAVTPEEALQLFYAQTNGKLTVVLRPILETGIISGPPYAPVL